MRKSASVVMLFLLACADGPLEGGPAFGGMSQRLGEEVEATLVADPHPGLGTELGSSPEGFAEVGGVVVFAATTEEHGTELWRSDGTEAGTRLLKDIYLGPESSSPTDFQRLGDRLVFVATSERYGREFWETDGTEAGTRLALDVTPGPRSEAIRAVGTLGDGLVFAVGSVLWTWDGTPGGATSLRDMATQNITFIGATSSTAFFRTNSGGSVHTMWATEGTTGTTASVASYLGTFGAISAPFGGYLFFDRNGGVLVRSNGTAAGTQDVLSGLIVHGLVARPDHLLVLGVRSGEPGIWLIENPVGAPSLLHPLLASANAFAPLGDGVVYSSMDGLFYADRTVAPRWIGPSATWVKAAGGQVYFAADVGAEGSQLFVTDGTAGGTLRLSNFPAGSQPSAFTAPAAAGDELWLQATTAAAGAEPWATDGTAGSLRQVANLQGPRLSSGPSTLTAFGDRLGFRARQPAAAVDSLWVASGNGVGQHVPTILAPSGEMIGAASHLVFVAGAGSEFLGRYFDYVQYSSFVSSIPIANLAPFSWNLTLFSAGTSSIGREPCVLNGTAVGCSDLFVGAGSSSPAEFTMVGDGAFFTATTPTYGVELWWRSSGSPTVRDIRPGSASSTPEELTAVNGALYFSADNGTSGRELWRALPAGTPALVRDIWPGATGSAPREFAAAGEVVLFTADTAPYGRELWRTDGITAGTQLVLDINPGTVSSQPRNLTSTGARVFFQATDSSGSEALYLSDGQATGTSRLDATVIPAGLRVQAPFLRVGGALAFVGGDDTHGDELWRTTGEPGSTWRVADVRPGAASSHPRDFVLSASRFYFTAHRDGTGREVFSVPATAIDLPPTITCPEPFTVQARESSGAIVDYPEPEADDAEGPVSITFNPPEGTRLPVGMNLVEAIATDVLGSTASCTFEVEVIGPPTLTCPSVTEEATSPSGAVAWFEAEIDDPTGGGAFTVTYSREPGSTFALGTTNVQVTAVRDDWTLTCTLPVTVRDTTPPEITCPGPIVAEAVNAQGAPVTFQAQASDIASTPTISYSPASGSVFALGTRTVTATATDGSGNKASCTFSVTVQDTTPPQLTCPQTVSVRPKSDDGATATYAASATDSVSAVTLTYSHASGSLFPVGVTSVTVTATDAASNESTCSFEVRVEGPPHLAITCPESIFAEATGLAGAPVEFEPEVYGGAPPVEISYSHPPGSIFSLGTRVVTVEASAADGEREVCAFEITVRDTTPPQITCPEAVVAEAVNAQGAPVPFQAQATDIASTPTVTYTIAPGSVFALGTRTVTATATDGVGLQASCSFPVTVQDTTPPHVTCPGTISLRPVSDEGASAQFEATATDSVSSVDLTYSHASGSVFPVGVTSVTVNATDAAGNASSCEFEVRIEGPPHLSVQCPAPIVWEATGPDGAAVTFAPEVYGGAPPVEIFYSDAPGSVFPLGRSDVSALVYASDGEWTECIIELDVRDSAPPEITCPYEVVAEATSPDGAIATFAATAVDRVSDTWIEYSSPSGTLFELGSRVVTATARDLFGNAASCSFYVHVVDTTPPVLSCPDELLVEATDASGAMAIFAVEAHDPVSTPVVTMSHASGSRFPFGRTAVTVSAIDAAGNRAQCLFDVVVADTTPPVLSCGDRVVEATSAFGQVVPLQVEAVDAVSDATVTLNRPADFRYPLGHTAVVATARDAAGNEATCTFDVIVQDTTPPQLNCPSTRTVEATGPDGASTTFAAGAYDQISQVTLDYTHASGSTFALGTTRVTVTARDAAGNASTCQFNVVVRDTTAPQISCPVEPALEATQPLGAAANYPPATATDAASTPTITYDPSPDVLLPMGATMVRATARDAAGNEASCSFIVTVADTTPPTLVCPGNFEAQATSAAGAQVHYAPVELSDLVSQPHLVAWPPSGAALPMGETEVQFTATDNAGNVSRCSFRVLVSNREPPVLACPASRTAEATQPEGAIVDFPAPQITEGFSKVTFDYSAPPKSLFPFGETRVDVTGRDEWNNTASCSFTITVQDTTPPTLVCPDDLQAEATSPQGAVVEWEAEASDAASEPRVDGSPRSGARYPLGRSHVTVSATDDVGNVSTCRFFVEVVDTTGPEVACPTELVRIAGEDGTAFVGVPPIEANDAVSSATVTFDPPLDEPAPIGTFEVTVTAVDQAGNESTCRFPVTVEPPGEVPVGEEEGVLVGGCACDGTGGEGSVAALALLGLAVLRRRR